MKNTLKVIKSFAVGGLFVSALAGAQVPVTDAGHIALQKVSWAKQVADMLVQYQQLKQTYESMNGSRGMANLVNNPASRKYLPANYQDILNGGYGSSADIRSQYKVYGIENTSLSPNSDAAKAFERVAKEAASNRAAGEAAYSQASKRFDALQVLLDKVNDAPNAKDMADLQGRIQAEQLMLQNETIKLQMLSHLRQAQKDLEAQQSKEIRMKSTQGEIPRF